MSRRKLLTPGVVCLLALTLACGNRQQNPVSPSTALPAETAAGPDGSTLKATAPTPQSPTSDARVDAGVVLVIQNATLRFATVPISYRFEIYNTANEKVYDSIQPAGSGGTTTHNVSGTLEFNKRHTWRARAEYLGAFGPWSSSASFLTPEGGYIRGSELLDPLTNAKTVGRRNGPFEFVPGQGIKLLAFTSHLTYELPTTLEEGEYSLMVTGIDEGSPGSKTKVMSMQEGYDDVTTNDYRFTVEKRGSAYTPGPGAVTFRIITGDDTNDDAINDSPRQVKGFSDELWYFWRIRWWTGGASLEVREGDENGPTVYDASVATDGHPYRPVPHVIHIGAPVGRGGELDASIPGMIAKNIWVSGRSRPRFITFTKP